MDKERILSIVNNALACQFVTYSWEDMIDDCDLTSEETKWAKENIGCRACIEE